MIPGLEGRRDFVARSERTQRETIGNSLGRSHDVGLNTVMLDGEHRAGTPEAGLHFVGNKEDAVPVQHFLHRFEVVARRHDDPAFAHHRLGKKRSNIAGSVEANYVLDSLGAFFAAALIALPLRTVGVRRRRKRNTGGIRSTTLFAAWHCR